VDNYYSDSRVQAGNSDKWYKSISDDQRSATVDLQFWVEDNGNEEFSHLQLIPDTHDLYIVPIRWEPCYTCEGRGTHVNPSVDCNGLTADDFAEDPDFADEYFSGVYDVQCYGCGGKRVEPVCNDKAVQKALDKWAEDEYHYQMMVASERRMGC
jgi:hypothetical protein